MVTPLGGVEDFYRSGGTLKPSGAAPLPLAEFELAPFVPVTSRVFCVGINYKTRGLRQAAGRPAAHCDIVGICRGRSR
jgi:hypothetical protein